MNAPEPLTPAECDLRDFAFMPFDVRRFRDSDMIAGEDAEVVLAAIMLWSASWHQVPAASLPDDDRMLAQLAGYGRAVKEWRKVRDGALRNFIKCSDGRLYHRTVSEKANEAWAEKLAYRDRKAKRTEAAQKAATARWHPDDDELAYRMPDGCATHNKDMRNASGKDAQRMNGEMPKGTGTGTGTVKPSPTLNDSIPKPSCANDCFNEVCLAADWTARTDAQRVEALSIVDGWLASGFDLNLDILAGIKAARSRKPERTRSLKRFTSTILGKHTDRQGVSLNGVGDLHRQQQTREIVSTVTDSLSVGAER